MTQHRTLVDDCQQLLEKGQNHEEIIRFLRDQGCSKVRSIGILAELLRVGLGEAKRIVHESRAWADVRERDELLHATLERDLNAKDG
jgi:ribosomal protein L7/L12